MAPIGKFPTSSHVDDQAAEWVARQDTGHLSAEEEAQFQLWLDRSPACREAYSRYESLWSEFGRLEEPEASPAIVVQRSDNAGHFSRRAVAAGLIAALGLGSGAVATLMQRPAYATPVGGLQTVALPDGSRVTLNTDTRIVVDYSNAERRIVLKRGEAFFEVKEELGRPFRVASSVSEIDASGSKFVVRLDAGSRCEVTVIEGTVAVSRAPAIYDIKAPEVMANVDAGRRLSISDEREDVQRLTEEEIGRAAAWRGRKIVFSGETLRQAIAEMQRYTPVNLVVDDAVGSFAVGGHFLTTDVLAFVEAVEATFPVSALRSKDEIRIVPRRT